VKPARLVDQLCERANVLEMDKTNKHVRTALAEMSAICRNRKPMAISCDGPGGYATPVGSNGTASLASALNRELGRLNRQGKAMIAFIQRLSIHYDIYRRYPLPRIPALRNAWRIARA
jgi:hypothetical protein